MNLSDIKLEVVVDDKGVKEKVDKIARLLEEIAVLVEEVNNSEIEVSVKGSGE
jgi:TusA-related sulfurtransferase